MALLGASSINTVRADVKFGELYPFSGQLALLGQESARGLELAVDKINKEGGVQGEKVVLVRGDAVDNSQAIGEARRLISRKHVKAIFGTYSSSRSIAASQVAELSGIPYFELGGVSNKITSRGFKYLFRTNPPASVMAETIIAMIQQAVAPKLGVDPSKLRIGLVHENSSYGTSTAKYERKDAKKAGLNVVTDQAYPDSTTDLSSIVLTLKHKKVDVVLATSYQNDAVLFLRQMHEKNYKPKAVIGGGGGYSMEPTAKAVGKNIIDGLLDVDFTQYNVNPKFTPGLKAYVKAYKAKYGSAPLSGHSLNNYAGALAILHAIDKADGFSPNAIIKAVRAIDIPAGHTADGYGIKFGKNGQNTRATMMGMQWQNGKLVTVFPKKAAVAELKLNQ
jgi:branched-chain amino acid transport system substrate-binding protein